MRSPGGALYWIRCIKVFTQFVAQDGVDPTMFAAPVFIPVRDPFLRMIKNFEGLTVPVDKARRQAEVAPAHL